MTQHLYGRTAPAGTRGTAGEKSIVVPAPAKINLRLKVVGRRAGYHLLSMVNVTTGFADIVTVGVTEGEGIALVCEGNTGDLPPEVTTNLAYRAAVAWGSRFGSPGRVTIQLDKRIPSGAGLGGGSSDAAAVLRALVELQRRGGGAAPSVSLLRELALGLGADVPYLLHGGLSVVEGIGELLTPLPGAFLDGCPCCIVWCGEHSSTPAVFAALRSSGGELTSDPWVDELRGVCRSGNETAGYAALLDGADNDLTRFALPVLPKTATTLARLLSLPAIVVGMTGSGGALYVVPRRFGSWDVGSEEAIRRVCDVVGARAEFTTLRGSGSGLVCGDGVVFPG